MITEENRAAVYYEYVEAILELDKTECDVDCVPEQSTRFLNLTRYLGIARANIEIQNNVGTHVKTVDPYTITNIFNAGNVDDTRYIRLVKRNGRENMVIYTIYQRIGDPDWTQEELNLIDAIFSLLYVYNARAQLTKHARYLSFYDRDLDMPNIVAFARDINRLLFQQEFCDYGTCRFNLKNFSAINSQVGLNRGTIVMKLFLKELKKLVGEDGEVYRIAGDNFLMIFKKEYFEKIRDYLKETIVYTEFEDMPQMTVSTSVGFFLNEENLQETEEIIRYTHQIGMAAKGERYKNCIVFNEEYAKRISAKSMIVQQFPNAIRNREFQVYYQPKYNSVTGEIVGAEALCRWIKDGRVITPAEFIPMLEQSVLICQLDFYMLDCVCQDLRRWIDEGKKPVRVSVNFSRVHLNNRFLAERINMTIEQYDIPHELVEIELTETTTDVDFKELKQVVLELNKEGINTSVDDFGVGYSSLNLIRELPWKVLKIDRSFLPVAGEPDKEQKIIVLKHIISMAVALGVECLAEGAETEEQVNLLKECGCTLIQGFYFSRPLPREQFELKF